MTHFNVKIISDHVCPWCYLGKTRLERAISLHRAAHPTDTFTTTWAPFYLDPSLPKTSVPVTTLMAARFGASRLEGMHARLRALGAAEGIHYTFEGKVGHTRDAHRVVQLAKSKGAEVENKVVAGIMRRYFEEGGDITSWQMLREAGVDGGLDGGEVDAWLEAGKGGEEVDREVERAYARGVTGVPFFEINGKWEVNGAQEVDVFLEQIKKAREAS